MPYPEVSRKRPPKSGHAAEVDGRAEYRAGPSMKALPLEVRPRERLKLQGAQALTEIDLIAIILGSGLVGHNVSEVARDLLVHKDGLAGVDRADLGDLQREPGIGPARAVQIKAALELGRRLVSLNPSQASKIGSPRDVYALLRAQMSWLEQEELRVVMLTTKNQVLAAPVLYKGSLNSTTVRMGELFREAIRQNAASIVLVHNHPSGDPTPSPEDVRLTRDAADAGKLLDIDVLDHVVIGRGDDGYVSLKERGLGFAAAAR